MDNFEQVRHIIRDIAIIVLLLAFVFAIVKISEHLLVPNCKVSGADSISIGDNIVIEGKQYRLVDLTDWYSLEKARADLKVIEE